MRNKHDICKPGQRVYAFTPISRVTVRTVNGFTICHERTMNMHDCVQAIAPLFDDLATRPRRTAISPYTNESVPSCHSLLIPSRTPLVYYPLQRLYSSSSLRLLTRFHCLRNLVPYSLHLCHLRCLKLVLLVLAFHSFHTASQYTLSTFFAPPQGL